MIEAIYKSGDQEVKFSSDKPSLVAPETDRNAPTEASGLRAEVINVQDQINRFLTEKMKMSKENSQRS